MQATPSAHCASAAGMFCALNASQRRVAVSTAEETALILRRWGCTKESQELGVSILRQRVLLCS
jgi:hypothetical protein